jgi:hypothetical protein
MEVHIPKPFHGWREFAKEIGIIVIGVLIALGAQQIVEWLHHRVEAAEARAALRSEVAANLALARLTIEQERCLSALWDRYAAWADGGPHPPAMKGAVTRHATGSWTIWDVVKTGAVAHMPLAERLSYAGHYAVVVRDDSDGALEVAATQRVLGQGAKAALTPADSERLLEDLRTVRSMGELRAAAALGRIQFAKARLGVTADPLPPLRREYLTRVCNLVGITPNL